MGIKNTMLHFSNLIDDQENNLRIKTMDQDETVGFLLDWLKEQINFNLVTALTGEVRLIEVSGKCYPSLPQIACYDTVFHTSCPIIH